MVKRVIDPWHHGKLLRNELQHTAVCVCVCMYVCMYVCVCVCVCVCKLIYVCFRLRMCLCPTCKVGRVLYTAYGMHVTNLFHQMTVQVPYGM